MNSEKLSGNRNIALDIAKGIGILLVIVGHTAGMKHIGVQLIYCFHMPLFFLIAGYLYHRQDFKTLCIKSAKRLLLPWAIALVIQILISIAWGRWDDALGFAQGFLFPDGTRDDYRWLANIHSSGAIWFLPALFWCRIIYALIEQRFAAKSYLITIPVTLAAVLLGRYVLNLPLAIQVGCSALLFYEIGYRANQFHVLERNIPWWVFVLFIPLWVFYERYVSFEMYWYQYGVTYPIDIVVAVFVTLMVVEFGERFTNIKFMRIIQECFTWLGVNSIYILCTHTFFLLILGYLNESLLWPGWGIILINMCLSIFTAFLYVKLKERLCHR